MSASDQLIPGATEDTYRVDYTLTAIGSPPPESKTIRITAEWDRESDLGVSKTLVAGGESFVAEERTTFAITIHNYGPAPTNGFNLEDGWTGNGTPLSITEVRQVSGPKALEAPRVADNGKIKGKWGQLDPGEDVTILVTVIARWSGIIGNRGEAYHDTISSSPSHRVEPAGDTHPNSFGKTFHAKPAPDSTIKAAGAGGASGTAEAGDRGAGDAQASPSGCRGNRAEEGPGCGSPPRRGQALQPDCRRSRPGSDGKCKWLASAGGRFTGRKPHKKVCDSPVWLTAQWDQALGTSAFHGLPPGNYMLYSRAVGAGGGRRGTLQLRRQNRRRFSVP